MALIRAVIFIKTMVKAFYRCNANNSPDIENIGMVTGAVWADVTGDKKKELIISGEWMRQEFFNIKTISLKK